MGQVSNPPTTGSTGGGTLLNPIFSITARGAVAANDLVTLFENGLISKTGTALSLALENNTTNGPTVVKATTEATGNYYRNVSYSEQMAWLANDCYVMAYIGNGTTNSTGVNFKIRNQLGNDTVPTVVVSSAASIGTLRVAKLNATQFVICWTEGTAFKFAIYNNDGTVAVATASIATLSTTNVESNNMAVTVAGDIVFAYTKVTSTDLVFKRYNSSGVLQGSETTIEAGSNGQYIAVKACANGDFVVFYYRAAATTGYKFARYTSVGVIVGTLTALGTYASTNFTVGKAGGAIAELVNGNIAMLAPSTTGADPSIYIYTAANALVTRTDLDISGFNANSIIPQIVATSSGMAAVGMLSDLMKMQTFTLAGLPITAATTVDTVIASPTDTNIDLYNIGVGFVVAVASSNSGGAGTMHLVEVDNLLAAKGSVVVVQSAGTYSANWSSSAMSPGYILTLQYTLQGSSTSKPKNAVYKCLRSSIFGVANTAAADGIQAQVNTIGNYTINQNVSAGGTFDQRAAAVVGNRGVVAGNSALLMGTV